MSPEQARGLDNLDARSDIYSVGALAYALLTGRPPFDGTNPMEVMIAHVRDEVVPPSKHQADVPADLERVDSPLSGQALRGPFSKRRQSRASPDAVHGGQPVDAGARRPLVARE